MLPSQYVQTLIENCARKFFPYGMSYAPNLFVGSFEPFSNVSKASRLENKRRIMYYYLTSRGLDANWVFDTTVLSDSDLLAKINSVQIYISNTSLGRSDVNPDAIYWLLWLIGDIPIDFSVRQDCTVNWSAVETFDQFFADIDNEYIWLKSDGNIDFNIMGHLHHQNTQPTFEEYYNLPFSEQQLSRPNASNSGKIETGKSNVAFSSKMSSISQSPAGTALQQRVTLDNCVNTVINGLKSAGKYEAAVKELGSAEAVKQTVTLACMKQMGMANDQEESKTPWGWIIGGVAVLLAGGTAVWYFSSKKSSK